MSAALAAPQRRPSAIEDGAPLRPLADWFERLGWQLVPAQWHPHGMTPIVGVTGRAPFLTAAQIPRINHLRLHRTGGPACDPRRGHFAKVALRPPLHVIGFDVDHDYDGKTGGDSLVNAEMELGPTPGTYSCTARGQHSPSRRRWYGGVPEDLIITDKFFADYGGCIETIRTGHRFSWTAPSVHIRRGRVVGPIQWYDPDGAPCRMPAVEQLGKLPAPWIARAREIAAQQAVQPVVLDVDPAGKTPITIRHANAVVDKMATRLHALPPEGGPFRDAVYGLAAVAARYALAAGGSRDDAHAAVREVFATHPLRLQMNADDERWTSEGFAAAAAQPWVFVPEADDLDMPAREITYPGEADDETLQMFVDELTGAHGPGKLAQRQGELKAAAGRPGAMVQVTYRMIFDAVEGAYPAADVVTTVAVAYRKAGGRNPGAPRKILSVALGAALADKADSK